MMTYLRIGAALLLLIGVITVAGFLYDPFGWKESKLEKAEVAAALSRGDAVKAQQEAGLYKDSTKVIVRSSQRNSTIEGIGTKNASTIQKSSGASERLNPELVSSINRGLCEYESTPGCSSN